MIVNDQDRVAIGLSRMRTFVRTLLSTLALGKRDFNVRFVDDHEIARLNGAFRCKAKPTDVLSFPWQEPSEIDKLKMRIGTRRREGSGLDGKVTKHKSSSADPRLLGPSLASAISSREFGHLLGDVVISAETAQRNARREGHSTEEEIRWLILHGTLHLLGFDHESDQGEMAALEVSLRQALGLNRKAAQANRERAAAKRRK